MKYDKKDYIGWGFKIDHKEINIGNIVKDDEDINSHKVWVDKFATTNLAVAHEFL